MSPRVNRRQFLTTVGAAAVVAGGSLDRALAALNPAPSQGRPRPNIVLIVADDLGYRELGVQGCPDIPTPNIDSIARAGVRFTNGYVSCPVCAPTRAGLATGRYQQRFGFEFNPGPSAPASFGLPRSETTLAERLKPLGYATGMVGKWHLGYRPELTPLRRGFDEFFGFLGGAHPYLPGGRGAAILRGDQPVEEKQYLTDAFAREAVGFIERHRSEPFFLYLPFNAVHSPLQAPESYLSRFAHISDPKRRTFAAMTAAMDDALGRVLQTLQARGLEEDTLLIFVSDNGGPTAQTTSTNAPLRGFKAQVFEGGIRVPFMMQWKGRLPAGKVYDQPVISLDIHPTAFAAATALDGARRQPVPHLDGVDLLPFLTGNPSGKPHEQLTWRFGTQHAIRQGDWKLLAGAPGQPQGLYHLAEDIGESHDLSAQMPEKVAELQAAYDAWNRQLVEPRWGQRAARRQQPARGQGQGAVAERFDRLDANHDGKLTPEEFPRPNVFRRLDTNGDRAVTLEEARAAAGRRGGGNR